MRQAIGATVVIGIAIIGLALPNQELSDIVIGFARSDPNDPSGDSSTLQVQPEAVRLWVPHSAADSLRLLGSLERGEQTYWAIQEACIEAMAGRPSNASGGRFSRAEPVLCSHTDVLRDAIALGRELGML